MQASLIIPTYNSIKTIERCVVSLKNQKLDQIEVIFIDDGSTDGTLEFLEKLDLSCIVLKNETNRGLAFSLNKAIKFSQSQLIMRLDSDDEMLPGRIGHQLNKMKMLDVDVVAGGVDLIGRIISIEMDHKSVKKVLNYRNPLFHPTVQCISICTFLQQCLVHLEMC